jgi:hypothetical protein
MRIREFHKHTDPDPQLQHCGMLHNSVINEFVPKLAL